MLQNYTRFNIKSLHPPHPALRPLVVNSLRPITLLFSPLVYTGLTKHGTSLCLRPLRGRTLPAGSAPAQPARTETARTDRPDSPRGRALAQPARPAARSEERRSSLTSPAEGVESPLHQQQGREGGGRQGPLARESGHPVPAPTECHAGNVPPDPAADWPARGTPPHKRCSLCCPYPPVLGAFPSLPIAADAPGAVQTRDRRSGALGTGGRHRCKMADAAPPRAAPAGGRGRRSQQTLRGTRPPRAGRRHFPAGSARGREGKGREGKARQGGQGSRVRVAATVLCGACG